MKIKTVLKKYNIFGSMLAAIEKEALKDNEITCFILDEKESSEFMILGGGDMYQGIPVKIHKSCKDIEERGMHDPRTFDKRLREHDDPGHDYQSNEERRVYGET